MSRATVTIRPTTSRASRLLLRSVAIAAVGVSAVGISLAAGTPVGAVGGSAAKGGLGLNPAALSAPKQWAEICGKRAGLVGTALTKGADNCRWLKVGGLTRRYLAYIPPGSARRPVVFMFHGGGQSGEQHYRISGWRELAEREQFIAVFPSGLVYHETGGDDRPHWNDYSLPCEAAPAPADWPVGQPYPADDLAYVDAILSDLRANASVDDRRIFASGFSNGSAFAKTVGLERTQTFAAIGSWAGSIEECVQNGVVVRDAIAPHLQQPARQALPTAWGVGAADDHFLPSYNKLRASQGLAPAKNVPVTVDFINSVVGQRLLRTQEDVETNGLLFQPATAVDITTWAGIGWSVGPNPTYASVQWAQPMAGNTAGNVLSYMLLKDVGHTYPNAVKGDPHRIKKSNGVNAAEVFWHFFTLHPK